MEAKKQVDRLYQQLISKLNTGIEVLTSLNSSNKRLKDIVEEYIKVLHSNLIDVETALETLHQNTIWDKLVIAFFGVTNAGKSTIIETLRARFDDSRDKDSDGLIVGTGESDFTKVCQEYNLSINGREFMLIDVPGIEGKEDDFKEEIIKALNKAHCIFFVNGENKKPDAALAEKISKYLADWVNVYSIYNISNYDEECERINLITNGYEKIEAEIEATLRYALGNIYRGNISTQGLIALASVASFHPQLKNTLGKTQNKLKGYFGNSRAMYEFSRFKDVELLIEEKSKNFTREIAESNRRKLIGLTKKTIHNIQDIIARESYNIDICQKSIERFETEVTYAFNAGKNQVRQKLRSIYNEMYDDLREELCDLIEDKPSQAAVNTIVANAYNRYLYQSQDAVNDIVQSINARLQKAKKEMSGLKGNVTGIHIADVMTFSIGIRSAIQEMEISIKDVRSFALDVGGSAVTGAGVGSIIPGLGTAIGAAIGAALGILKHWIFGDGGKGKARKVVIDTLEESWSRNIVQLDRTIQGITNKLNNNQRNFVSQIQIEKNNLLEMHEIINKIQLHLRSFINELK